MLFVSLVISLCSTEVVAQQCSKVYDLNGDHVQDAYIVDNVKGLFFSEERARKILATLSEYEMLKKRTELYEDKIVILESSLKESKSQSDFWMKSYQKANDALVSLAAQPNFFKTDTAYFIYGLLAASISYGYWDYARD
jgi:hypothetical protein